MKSASVAEVKNKLSEYIARVSLTGEHIVITKRDKPVAILAGIEHIDQLKTAGELEGLAAAVGKWEAFDEIADDIENAWASRGKDAGRKISL